MDLGMKGNEIKLVAHNEEWAKEFLRVQEEISCSTKLDKERIEHVGSTAIKGMVAKPILDILVGVDRLKDIEDTLFDALQEIGFYRLKVVRKDEIVLAKFTDRSFKEKTHFIHLVEYKGRIWSDLIYFRNYLQDSKSARDEYEELKTSFIKNQTGDINDYTDYKENFVRRIVEKNDDISGDPNRV